MKKVYDKKGKLRPRGIFLLPNFFTVSALFAGFYAIVAAMKGGFSNAAIAVFIGMVLDSLDGRVARLTHSQTAFGAELDSLSDMVSFGVAPALVVYSFALYNFGKIGWLIAFTYTVATALRLARFNTQVERADKRYFQGLPSPAAAGVVAGYVWCVTKLAWHGFFIWVVAGVITAFVAVLMVSNVRYHSFKDFDLKNHVSFIAILVVVFVLILISIAPSTILFLLFSCYALSGVVNTIRQLNKKRKIKREKNRKRKAV